jgi:hypothetical protein
MYINNNNTEKRHKRPVILLNRTLLLRSAKLSGNFAPSSSGGTWKRRGVIPQKVRHPPTFDRVGLRPPGRNGTHRVVPGRKKRYRRDSWVVRASRPPKMLHPEAHYSVGLRLPNPPGTHRVVPDQKRRWRREPWVVGASRRRPVVQTQTTADVLVIGGKR